ncbi:MAG: nucleotidyltransferase domain-containing protein [Egibacteraceae bacterium]
MFGSRATGRHRPDSDAGVAVTADTPLSLLAQAALANRLGDLGGHGELDRHGRRITGLDTHARALGAPLFTRCLEQVRARGAFADQRLAPRGLELGPSP